MIKVVNITMEGRYAGPHAFIAAIAERLKSENIETVVVFPDKDSDVFLRKLCVIDVAAKKLPLHRLAKDKRLLIKYVIFFIPELFSLYKLIVRIGANIVHCNHSWQIKGVLAAKLARKPVVWTIHETQMPTSINIIFRFLALHFCDAFITAGEKVRAYYLSDGRFSEKQIVEIQAPVDTSIFDPEKVKKDRKIRNYSGVKIVTVGNVNPLKGIEYFMEMASILGKQHGDLNFFVVGPHYSSQKRYSKKLRKTVEDLKLKNFHFCGQTEDVPSVLKSADIYVCSSVAEASPISVWEAMSMAKPIVSTDVGDVARFIKNGENGFIVPIKDARALAEKVALLIQEQEMRREFGLKAREAAINHLDLEICTQKHTKLYTELMKES